MQIAKGGRSSIFMVFEVFIKVLKILEDLVNLKI